MTPRILIIDDETPARERLKTLLSDIAAECPHQLAGEAANGQQALERIAALQPDVILLDVQMPGMTGIELTDRLAGLPSAPAVIFVTAYDAYALKAFDVHAVDYLLKPVRAARLAEAIRRATARAGTGNGSSASQVVEPAVQPVRQHFSVQERGRLMLVPVADVVYCKAELKYVTLRTLAQDFLIEESLSSIEEELGSVFVRVHRNALVARSAIAGVERSAAAIDGEAEGEKGQETWQVILRGLHERLPISRRQWPVVKALVR